MAADRIKPYTAKTAPPSHAVPFVFYLLVNLAILFWGHPSLSLRTVLTWPWLLVFGLATFRVADILANEAVTKVLRAPFVNVKESPDGHTEEVPKPSGWRKTVGSLLYCPSCLGVWIASFFVYSYIYLPRIAWIVAAVFALSAMERVWSIVLDRIEGRE